jgi:hypothetical protein
LPLSDSLHTLLWSAHFYLAFAFFALILLHVAAALFHALVRRDGVFQAMASAVPATRSRPLSENATRHDEAGKTSDLAATRDQVYPFARKAIELGYGEAAGAPVIRFEWLQRPENVRGRASDQRSRDHSVDPRSHSCLTNGIGGTFTTTCY